MSDAYNTSTSFADFSFTKVHDAAMLEATDFTNNPALQLAFDASDLFQPGQSALQVPYMQDTNLQAVTEGTAIDRVQYSSTKRTLTATTHYADIASITDKALVLANQGLWEPLGQLYGAACKRTLEVALLGLYTNSPSDVTNATTADIDEDDILSAKKILDDANCPPDNRYGIVSTKEYGKLIKIARFSEYQTTGQNGIIQQGVVPMIHGFAIYMSQNVVTASGLARNIFGRKGGLLDSSMCYAWRKFPPPVSGVPYTGDKIRFTFGRNMPYVADEMGVEIMYGVASLRTEWIVEVQSQD